MKNKSNGNILFTTCFDIMTFCECESKINRKWIKFQLKKTYSCSILFKKEYFEINKKRTLNTLVNAFMNSVRNYKLLSIS